MATRAQRERERARRQQEKYAHRRAQKAAVRRRRWSVAGLAAALVVLGGIVAAAVVLDDDPGSGTTGAPTSSASSAAATPRPAGTAAPDPALAEGRDRDATLTTSAGTIGLTLDGAAAPQAVANFVDLAGRGFYDGTDCHRLTTSGIYVLQCGDPTGTGTGGPGYTFGPIENAPADGVYPAGTVAMARASTPDSMGSQFFLVYEDTELPTDGGGYTVFGTITSGLDTVRAVADAGTADGTSDGPPATPVTIEGAEVQ
ncbi:peptidylprolyl isomerase [Cellulomonas sp. PhB143]|uniref:peptidylprolyl isomerase n=1 Tax=Cellulomonas sp. PhB143 TaxID=2485186 RepID=UPI000F493C48|nr:peptidylprolyl isomerase [Cellulomonas sp. PhB143]ROS74571.1 peptidyl-prolyl cis-trans isomerase B (cyclophilin B) [Cellulomonas sp. PhB143]